MSEALKALRQEVDNRGLNVKSFVLVTMTKDGNANVATNGEKIDLFFMEKLLSVILSGKLAAEINKTLHPADRNSDA